MPELVDLLDSANQKFDPSGTTLTSTDAEAAIKEVDAKTGGGGSGDVVGPASAVDGNLATFNGTTGKIIQDGGVSASSFDTAGSAAGVQSNLDTHIADNTNPHQVSGNSRGTGQGDVYAGVSSGVLQFKSLRQGSNVTITEDADEVTIASTGGGGDLSNAVFPDSAHFASEVAADATVAFTDSNKQSVDAAVNSSLTLTAPGVGNYLLRIANSASLVGISPTPLWDSGNAPTWAGTSILSLYYDGTNWYGSAIVGVA